MKQVQKIEIPLNNPGSVTLTIQIADKWIGAEFGLDGLLYIRGIVNTNHQSEKVRFYVLRDFEAIPDVSVLEYVGSAVHRSHVNPRPVHVFAEYIVQPR